MRPLEVNVKTEKHLKALSGMYRVGIGGRKIPIRKSDKYLIGKKILIKSPLTCGCKDGYICETCYGELSKININKGIGALAAAMTTEPVSQNVLSTKHLNRTDSEIITFKDGFDSIFILNSNEIFTKLDIEKPLRSFNIIIDKYSILSLSADDEDLEMNKYVLSFKVKDTSNGEIIDISTNVVKPNITPGVTNTYIRVGLNIPISVSLKKKNKVGYSDYADLSTYSSFLQSVSSS